MDKKLSRLLSAALNQADDLTCTLYKIAQEVYIVHGQQKGQKSTGSRIDGSSSSRRALAASASERLNHRALNSSARRYAEQRVKS